MNEKDNIDRSYDGESEKDESTSVPGGNIDSHKKEMSDAVGDSESSGAREAVTKGENSTHSDLDGSSFEATAETDEMPKEFSEREIKTIDAVPEKSENKNRKNNSANDNETSFNDTSAHNAHNVRSFHLQGAGKLTFGFDSNGRGEKERPEVEPPNVSRDLIRKVTKDVSVMKKSDIAIEVIKYVCSFVALLAVSFVMAVAVWIYVLNIDSNEYEKTFIVSVNIENSDKILNTMPGGNETYRIYTDDKITATVTLTGRRNEIYDITNDNLSEYIEFFIDASKVTETGTNVLEVEFAQKGYDVNLNVISTEPKTVTVLADAEIKKNIEIKDNISYILNSPLYEIYTSSTELSISNVEINGPKTILDNIVSGRVFFDMGSVSQSRNIDGVPIEYVDAEGNIISSKYITSDNNTVNVQLMVKTERTVELNVVCDDNAVNMTAKAVPETIVISGDPKILDDVGASLILYSGNLFDEDITEPCSKIIKIADIKFPDGVDCGSDVGGTITVIFEYLSEKVDSDSVTSLE